MEITATAKSGFTGVGFTKTVTFEEAHAKKLHGVILQLKKRYRQIIGVKDDRGMWAISKHFGEEQFDFCILMETDGLPEVLPAGMISFQVPPLTYAYARHPQDENPEATYRNVYQWIKANGFQLNDKAFTHMEFYPIDQDLSAPEFDIYVPIIRSPH